MTGSDSNKSKLGVQPDKGSTIMIPVETPTDFDVLGNKDNLIQKDASDHGYTIKSINVY